MSDLDLVSQIDDPSVDTTESPVDNSVDLPDSYEYHIENLRKKFPQYFDETHELYRTDRRYKTCGSDTIVVLVPTDKTVTNEERVVKDKRHAKYRGSKFFVEHIFYKLMPDNPVYIARNVIHNLKLLIYETGKNVESEFCEDIDMVCASGIHYFTTIKTAFYYNLHARFDGMYMEWNGDGLKMTEDHYKNSQLYASDNWWGNGIKHHEFQKKVKNTCWYSNGQKELESIYENEVLKHSCHWNRDGILMRKTVYQDDDVKIREDFYANGKIEKRRAFDRADNKHGLSEEWSESGVKICEAVYLHGIRKTMKLWDQNGILYQEVTGTADGGTKQMIWKVSRIDDTTACNTEDSNTIETIDNIKFIRQLECEYYRDDLGRKHGSSKEWNGEKCVRHEEWDHGILVLKHV